MQNCTTGWTHPAALCEILSFMMFSFEMQCLCSWPGVEGVLKMFISFSQWISLIDVAVIVLLVRKETHFTCSFCRRIDQNAEASTGSDFEDLLHFSCRKNIKKHVYCKVNALSHISVKQWTPHHAQPTRRGGWTETEKQKDKRKWVSSIIYMFKWSEQISNSFSYISSFKHIWISNKGELNL